MHFLQYKGGGHVEGIIEVITVNVFGNLDDRFERNWISSDSVYSCCLSACGSGQLRSRTLGVTDREASNGVFITDR